MGKDDHDKVWSIETLKEFYDARLAENQFRSDERFEQIQKQLSDGNSQLSERFEQANRYRETYQQQINEGIKRVEFDSRIQSLQEKIEALSRFDLTKWLSFFGIVSAAVAAIWVIIGLKIDSVNQPTLINLEQLKIAEESRDRAFNEFKLEFKTYQQAADAEDNNRSREIASLKQSTEGSRIDRAQLNDRIRLIEAAVASSSTADASSRTDRNQLNERLHQLEGAMAANNAERKSNEATFKSALTEIETQFCGSDSIRSLMHANDLRVMSVLWSHIPGLGHYPTDNVYYPRICNRTENDRK